MTFRTSGPPTTTVLSMLTLLLLAISQFGCPPTTTDGTSSDGGGGLLVKTLSPSDSAQRVEIADKVAVQVPAGLLKGDTLLRISATTSAVTTDSTDNWRTFAGYNIELGDLHELDQDLVIEIPYDPALVPAGEAPAAHFMAAYWDPQQDALVTLPITVDTDRHTLVIRTRHLTDVYTFDRWTEGTLYDEQFVLSYWPAVVREETGPTTSWYKHGDPARPTRDWDVPLYVEDVWWQLHSSLDTYVNTGLATRGKDLIVTTVGGHGFPSRGKILGRINITLDCAGGYERLRAIVAHELFHCVQNRDYFNILKMTANTWWMEATADYASCRIAWPGSTMGGDLEKDYLSMPLNVSSLVTDHAYNTAWFIDFLVTHKGIDFVDMFKSVAASWNIDLTVPLDDYLTGSGGLAQCYKEFAEYWLFDPTSPVADQLQGDGLQTLAMTRGAVDLDPNDTLEFTTYAASLCSSLQRIVTTVDSSQSPAIATLKAADAPWFYDNLYAVLYVTSQDSVGSARRVGEVHGAGGSVEVSVSPGDVLYVLVVNGNRSQSMSSCNLVLTLKPTPEQTQPVTWNAVNTFQGDCFQDLRGEIDTAMQTSVSLSGNIKYVGTTRPTLNPCSDAPFCVDIRGAAQITGADLSVAVSYTPSSMSYMAECAPGYPTWEVTFGNIMAVNVEYSASPLPVVLLPSGQTYHAALPYISGDATTNIWKLQAKTKVSIQRGEKVCGTGATNWEVTDPHSCLAANGDLFLVKIHTKGP